jgi:hypothetical protein
MPQDAQHEHETSVDLKAALIIEIEDNIYYEVLVSLIRWGIRIRGAATLQGAEC